MRKQKAERSALGFYFQSGKMNGAGNTAKWLLYATGKSAQSTVSVLEKMYLTKHHPLQPHGCRGRRYFCSGG